MNLIKLVQSLPDVIFLLGRTLANKPILNIMCKVAILENQLGVTQALLPPGNDLFDFQIAMELNSSALAC